MVNFKDGELVKGAYVIIDGKEYEVHMPQYSGETPLSPENLNKVQNDLNETITEQGKMLNDKITNANIYSTQEVNTGKKWIDGKDIYSRTYNGECNSDSSQTVASNLTYIDTMVKIEGTFQRKSDKLASPIGAFFNISSGQSRGLWQGTKKELIIEKDASIWNTNFDFIITVEYTKTS